MPSALQFTLFALARHSFPPSLEFPSASVSIYLTTLGIQVHAVGSFDFSANQLGHSVKLFVKMINAPGLTPFGFESLLSSKLNTMKSSLHRPVHVVYGGACSAEQGLALWRRTIAHWGC